MKYFQKSDAKIIHLLLFVLIFINCNTLSDNKLEKKGPSMKSETGFKITTFTTIGIDEAVKKEDEPYQISSISSVDCDNHGNIFLLDHKSNCVRVYDQSGKFLRKMFRRGQGPKEIVNAYEIAVNQFSNTLYVLNEHGFKLKHFTLDGKYLDNIFLPQQLFRYIQFTTADSMIVVSDCKYGEVSYYNIKELSLQTKKITGSFLPYAEKDRDSSFNHWQRFAIRDKILWTSTTDTMDLIGIDLGTGKIVKTIGMPGNYKKNYLYESSYQGNKMLGLLAFNVAQPLILDNELFVLLTEREYDLDKKPNWKVVSSPISWKLSLFKVIENEEIIKVTSLDQFDFMNLECTYKNRIIFSSSNPYPHIKILEVKGI
jgi:hypothetical protein